MGHSWEDRSLGGVRLSKYRIEFDADTCFWCRDCELVCSLYHEEACSPSLSRINISLDVFQQEVEAIICLQCKKPICITACTVEGAMMIDEKTGSVIIDKERCIGCGNCAQACPFNAEERVIKLNPLTGTYIKCDLCGGSPKCLELCPTGALSYVQF